MYFTIIFVISTSNCVGINQIMYEISGTLSLIYTKFVHLFEINPLPTLSLDSLDLPPCHRMPMALVEYCLQSWYIHSGAARAMVKG